MWLIRKAPRTSYKTRRENQKEKLPSGTSRERRAKSSGYVRRSDLQSFPI
jgi:hypothetical protein